MAAFRHILNSVHRWLMDLAHSGFPIREGSFMPDPLIVSIHGLHLHIPASEDTVVIECRGSLTFEVSDFLKREVKSRMPEHGRLVLDLSDATRMDSSGLGAIVALYLSARRRNCDFVLVNLNKQIRDLLALSNLLSIFETVGRDGIRMP
jgi:anti-anti-sigma factor